MKIKPCPFCGSEAKLKIIEDNSDYCFEKTTGKIKQYYDCLLYTSPSPRDRQKSRMPSSA